MPPGGEGGDTRGPAVYQLARVDSWQRVAGSVQRLESGARLLEEGGGTLQWEGRFAALRQPDTT